MKWSWGVLLAVACAGGAAYSAGGTDSAVPHDPSRQCATSSHWVHVPAGTVLMGEDGQERPGKSIGVKEFWIEDHEVTNGEFAQFVAATGHVTQAEREGGSAVFVPPQDGNANLDTPNWWRFVNGADWRHPGGAGSDIRGKAWLPVVHVTFEDAQAYAHWRGAELPDDVQWERAARAGQDQPRNPLSWAFAKDSTPIANTWQGVFPVLDTGQDHYRGIAPVGCFPANALGLYDMIGNVWEWTSTSASTDGKQRLLKGGSYLCALNYCANFRAAAFQAEEHDLGTSHVGFRTIRLTAPSVPEARSVTEPIS